MLFAAAAAAAAGRTPAANRNVSQRGRRLYLYLYLHLWPSTRRCSEPRPLSRLRRRQRRCNLAPITLCGSDAPPLRLRTWAPRPPRSLAAPPRGATCCGRRAGWIKYCPPPLAPCRHSINGLLCLKSLSSPIDNPTRARLTTTSPARSYGVVRRHTGRGRSERAQCNARQQQQRRAHNIAAPK